VNGPYIINADGSIDFAATRRAVSLFASQVTRRKHMQVDYFLGRPVKSVEDNDDGGWSIVFEDGSVIRSHDPDLGSPGQGIVGVSLNRVDMSSGTTVLNFGPKDNPLGTQINMNPVKYSVTDPSYTKGEEVFPQRGAAEPDPSPEDPSPERVKDGPSQKWKDEQPKPDKKTTSTQSKSKAK
jgi:hypothetical protein